MIAETLYWAFEASNFGVLLAIDGVGLVESRDNGGSNGLRQDTHRTLMPARDGAKLIPGATLPVKQSCARN